MSINKVILVGNVGKDPVVKYFDKGVAKATFPLATSESYTNQKGDTVTATEWHNIVFWRSLAEVVDRTVKKGSQLYIVGKIQTRSYTDKDGVNKYITEILGDTLIVLDKKTTTPSPQTPTGVTPPPVPPAPPSTTPQTESKVNDAPFSTPDIKSESEGDDMPF